MSSTETVLYVVAPISAATLDELKSLGYSPVGPGTDPYLMKEDYTYLVLNGSSTHYRATSVAGTHECSELVFLEYCRNLVDFQEPDCTEVLDNSVPGAKADSGKPDPTLIFDSMPRALTAIATVGTFGAKKYSRDGWLAVPNGEQRYAAAQDRHRLARCSGERDDAESNLPHLYHEAWNALAKLELALRTGGSLDDK